MIEQRSANSLGCKVRRKCYGTPLSQTTATSWFKMILMLSLSMTAVHTLAQSYANLGPLFFNAAERQAIVQERVGPAEQEKPPSIVTLSGVLVRSGGKGTAWINGQAVPEGHSPFPGVPVTILPGHIRIKNQAVRPGEMLDLTNSHRVDTLAAGSVTRR